MVLVGVATVFCVVAIAAIATAVTRPRTCHYCGEEQPRRRLRRLELSNAGDVNVCSDTATCRKRHQRNLAR
jgi:hypothetical protein